MPIFIHSPNGPALAGDVDETTARAELTVGAGRSDPTAGRGTVDGSLGPTDDTGVTEVRAHIGIHRCRRVRVMVNFAGEERERRFVPTATIQAVRRWAVGTHGFDLPAADRQDHEVGVCGTGVVADRSVRVGTLATRCALCLDLAPRDRFQG